MVDRIAVEALTLIARVRGWLKDESGQDLIEYGLLGGFIALVITGLALTVFRGPITDMFTGIGGCIDFDSTSDCTPF